MNNGALSITEYAHGVVRVIAKKTKFNWVHPNHKEGQQGVGSGFFIDHEGHILTAAHVVAESMEVFIHVPKLGRQEYPVQIVGVCFDLDLALLRANVKDIPMKIYPFKLGNSDLTSLGDDVYAVGFPLNQEQVSASKGIISARQSGGNFQTTADLNPGNSGGPLFKGDQVIAVNVAIIRGSNGIGYAVPVALYQIIEEELKRPNLIKFDDLTKIRIKPSEPKKQNKMEKIQIAAGQQVDEDTIHLPNLVKRPDLAGIGFNATNEALNSLKQADCKHHGVHIVLVSPESPFEKIGLKPGNILCEINNKKIDYHGMIESDYNADEKVQVHEVFNKIKNNAEIPVKYSNGGSGLVTRMMKASPYENAIHRKFPEYEDIDYEIFGGLIIMDLCLNHVMEVSPEMTQRLFKYMDRKNRIHPRLVVTEVYPTSEFQRLETFSRGDIIKKVNNREVNTLDEYREAMLYPIYRNGEYYTSIEDDMGCLGVMRTHDLLHQEEKLGRQFSYRSTLYSELVEKTEYRREKGLKRQRPQDEDPNQTQDIKAVAISEGEIPPHILAIIDREIPTQNEDQTQISKKIGGSQESWKDSLGAGKSLISSSTPLGRYKPKNYIKTNFLC